VISFYFPPGFMLLLPPPFPDPFFQFSPVPPSPSVSAEGMGYYGIRRGEESPETFFEFRFIVFLLMFLTR